MFLSGPCTTPGHARALSEVLERWARLQQRYTFVVGPSSSLFHSLVLANIQERLETLTQNGRLCSDSRAAQLARLLENTLQKSLYSCVNILQKLLKTNQEQMWR